MSAEFFIRFKDRNWYVKNLEKVEEEICKLKTFTVKDDREFKLLGSEARNDEKRWSYDVRLFPKEDAYIFMDISAHPPSIERDLSTFFSWLRKQTSISIEDEDDMPSGW